ncbi:hypothetical protein BH10BDE1_BH10BDE1_28010 [soil metagenome]
MACKSLDVANAFVLAGVPTLTPMKIQKLVYFAHGWCLALSGQPLIDEEFEAWTHGPVVPAIYHAFKHYGAAVVDQPSRRGTSAVPAELTPLINRIIRRYGHLSGFTLSELTHKENSAWSRVYGSQHCTIDNRLITADFKAVLKDG